MIRLKQQSKLHPKPLMMQMMKKMLQQKTLQKMMLSMRVIVVMYLPKERRSQQMKIKRNFQVANKMMLKKMRKMLVTS